MFSLATKWSCWIAGSARTDVAFKHCEQARNSLTKHIPNMFLMLFVVVVVVVVLLQIFNWALANKITPLFTYIFMAELISCEHF